MTPSAHRIRRLRWRASAAAPAEAFALRTLLRERGELLQAALGRAFDAAWPGEAVLHLPRLELALSPADMALLQSQLPAELEDAARQAVGAALAALGVRGAAAPPSRGPVPEASDAAADADAARVLDAPQARREALRHYLVSGSLPWTLAGLAPEQAQALLQQAAEELVTAAADGGGGAIDALVDGAPAAQRAGRFVRLLALLAPSSRHALVALHDTPAAPPAVRAAWRVLLGSAEPPADLLAAWLAVGADRAAAGAWAERASQWLHDTPSVAGGDALRAVLHSWLAAAPTTPARTPVPAERRRAPPVSARGDRRAPLRARVAPSADDAAADERRVDAAPPGAQRDAAPGLLVPLAGLVLLHPYLPRLLQACALHDTASPGSPPQPLERACVLLHALAHGSDEPGRSAAPAEHQLPLVKLLLGHTPDAPLAQALPALDAHDLAEVEALLDAVRGHWSALRGTSVQGLRSSFLQRRGLLEHADGAWRLRLQGEPWDMLVALLPWPLSHLRLPWMPEPLLVDWPTP